MIVTLYPESKENSIDLAQEIIKECSELLQEPEKSKAKPATKILSGLILASRRFDVLPESCLRLRLTSHIRCYSQRRTFRFVAGLAAIIPSIPYRIGNSASRTDLVRYCGTSWISRKGISHGRDYKITQQGESG